MAAAPPGSAPRRVVEILHARLNAETDGGRRLALLYVADAVAKAATKAASKVSDWRIGMTIEDSIEDRRNER